MGVGTLLERQQPRLDSPTRLLRTGGNERRREDKVGRGESSTVGGGGRGD